MKKEPKRFCGINIYFTVAFKGLIFILIFFPAVVALRNRRMQLSYMSGLQMHSRWRKSGQVCIDCVHTFTLLVCCYIVDLHD